MLGYDWVLVTLHCGLQLFWARKLELVTLNMIISVAHQTIATRLMKESACNNSFW